jgi:hypothetical protein
MLHSRKWWTLDADGSNLLRHLRDRGKKGFAGSQVTRRQVSGYFYSIKVCTSALQQVHSFEVPAATPLMEPPRNIAARIEHTVP